MQFNRARWYDAQSGQWMSEDPIGFAAGDVNLRRYVANGATAEPSGLQRVWPRKDLNDFLNLQPIYPTDPNGLDPGFYGVYDPYAPPNTATASTTTIRR